VSGGASIFLHGDRNRKSEIDVDVLITNCVTKLLEIRNTDAIIRQATSRVAIPSDLMNAAIIIKEARKKCI